MLMGDIYCTLSSHTITCQITLLVSVIKTASVEGALCSFYFRRNPNKIF